MLPPSCCDTCRLPVLFLGPGRDGGAEVGKTQGKDMRVPRRRRRRARNTRHRDSDCVLSAHCMPGPVLDLCIISPNADKREELGYSSLGALQTSPCLPL